jgi:hypothetical protein
MIPGSNLSDPGYRYRSLIDSFGRAARGNSDKSKSVKVRHVAALDRRHRPEGRCQPVKLRSGYLALPMDPVSVIKGLVVVAAAIGTIAGGFAAIAGIVGFFDGRRLKVFIRPESLPASDGPYRFELFSFSLLNERDHPVNVVTYGIAGQDVHGRYWRLDMLQAAPPPQVVIRGSPFNWQVLFKQAGSFGLDPEKRIYGWAKIAQPPRTIWSHRVTAGPQRWGIPRIRPLPLGRPAGKPPEPPPWWVRGLPVRRPHSAPANGASSA